MADAYPTLLDLALKHNADQMAGLIEQNLLRYPEAKLIPARTIVGTTYKTFLRSDYAAPGFRNVNQGVQSLKSTYDEKLVQCFFLDGHAQIDEAVAGADDNNIASQMQLEAEGLVKGALRTLGQQVWDGTLSRDAKGFPGARQIVDSSLVVDATGTTASTGSSCYLLIKGVQYGTFVLGNERIFGLPAWGRQRIGDPNDSTKHLMAWITNIAGWVGFQWVNKYCVGRIKNLTNDSGKGLTDALIAQLISVFPDDADLSNATLFMTRRSAYQLQKSRSATSVSNLGNRTSGGVDIQAPWPTDSNGISIEITSGITNTETIA